MNDKKWRSPLSLTAVQQIATFDLIGAQLCLKQAEMPDDDSQIAGEGERHA
jgi:hypothetical protein